MQRYRRLTQSSEKAVLSVVHGCIEGHAQGQDKKSLLLFSVVVYHDFWLGSIIIIEFQNIRKLVNLPKLLHLSRHNTSISSIRCCAHENSWQKFPGQQGKTSSVHRPRVNFSPPSCLLLLVYILLKVLTICFAFFGGF